MRSATASRAVSISTGTRLPAPRRRRHTSRPSIPGMPTSSTTASGSARRDLGQALLPALGGHHLVPAQRERAPQRVAHRAVVVHHEDPHQSHCDQRAPAGRGAFLCRSSTPLSCRLPRRRSTGGTDTTTEADSMRGKRTHRDRRTGGDPCSAAGRPRWRRAAATTATRPRTPSSATPRSASA